MPSPPAAGCVATERGVICAPRARQADVVHVDAARRDALVIGVVDGERQPLLPRRLQRVGHLRGGPRRRAGAPVARDGADLLEALPDVPDQRVRGVFGVPVLARLTARRCHEFAMQSGRGQRRAVEAAVRPGSAYATATARASGSYWACHWANERSASITRNGDPLPMTGWYRLPDHASEAASRRVPWSTSGLRRDAGNRWPAPSPG